MRLPSSLRQAVARLLTGWRKECGGVLMDFGFGKVEIIHHYENVEQQQQARELILNLFGRSGYDIWVLLVKVANGAGHFIVMDTKRTVWTRAFYRNLYTFREADHDVLMKCQMLATEAGYKLQFEDKRDAA